MSLAALMVTVLTSCSHVMGRTIVVITAMKLTAVSVIMDEVNFMSQFSVFNQLDWIFHHWIVTS